LGRIFGSERGRRKEGKKERRKEGKKERRKEGKKERRKEGKKERKGTETKWRLIVRTHPSQKRRRVGTLKIIC
jgi:hypothetical protein